MEIMLLLKVEDNIALIFNPATQEQLSVNLTTQQANYYQELLDDTADDEDFLVNYNPKTRTFVI